ncbi:MULTISPECIES: AAA family ATPase [unclassified Actinomyces]|uniref:AAA family ATPase n=1 Tax=unclassified Actinomyces TaxID=2609248 RepID=UPI000D5977BF|nr:MULTISPECIES: SMC family ATPase [unclassified Actinomyces]RAX22628.1 SMC family ATPase [Actinomyces sp. Z3]
MRLHRLTITGVGPFRGTETIDFDRFAASGRFLLTGPTGSGKTTIIDAIVFALYGQVADSDGSSKQRIRSTLVDPAVRSTVDLVFSTSAGVYRVLRTPEYMRPKQRGSGTTKQNATVKLWRMSAPAGATVDEPITRVDEAGKEIRRIVGLDREQFTQTVILPQGKFARFLRATSDQRHELLRDVFGTGIFDAMQEELRARRRDVERQTEAARQVLRTRADVLAPLLSAPVTPPPVTDAPTDDASAAPGVGASTGVPADEPAWPDDVIEPGPYSSPAARLEALVTAAAPDAAAIIAFGEEAVGAAQAAAAPAEQALQVADAARREASATLDAARALQERLSRRARLLSEQQQLDATAAQDADAAARLDAARRAGPVARALARARDAARTAEAARSRAAQTLADAAPAEAADADSDSARAVTAAEAVPARAALDGLAALLSTEAGGTGTAAEPTADSDAHQTVPTPEVEPALAAVTAAAAALTERGQSLRTRAGALSAVVEVEAGLPARAQASQAEQERLTATAAEVERAAAQLAQRPGLQAELVERLTAAREAQAGLAQARVTRDACRERLQAAQRAEALEPRIAAARDAVQQAAAEALTAAGLVAQRRSAWITTTAGSLATELVDGRPCPLCGSTEHPSPATPGESAVSRTQVEDAEAAQQQADAALAARTREHDALVTEQAAARAQAGEDSVADLTQSLETAAAQLEAAERTAAPLAQLEAELAEFTEVTDQLREGLDQRRSRLAEDRARLEAGAAALTQDRERCRNARGEHESVAARMRSLAGAADAAAELAGLLTTAGDTARTVVQERGELADVVAQAGFVSAEQAATASLPGPDLAALEAQVNEATARRERVRQALTEDEAIASLTGEEIADVDGARERLAAADAAYEAALQAREQARAFLARVRDAAAGLADAADTLTTAMEDSAALLEVAALATGSNDAATPLSTWVLLERFNDVLAFANDRLDQMSAGRYALVRVADEAGSARRKDRGLGLGVVDRFSDSGVRDPKTLSGGETFYVSLSLALALADVVTAESGGVSMDTLFIDEGFGSLDPETLQAVLAELGRLQAGGRTVGIVSHVEELRRQVADRIEVTRSPTGSTLRTIAS